MAIQLKLDRWQYFEDAITLYQGDQWLLTGRIVDRTPGVDRPVSLVGASATAFFPPGTAQAAPATPVLTVSVTDSGNGNVSIVVPPSLTNATSIGLADGVQLYLAVAGLSGQFPPLVTVSTPDQPLFIQPPASFPL
jgi:hypothetical protein